MECRLFAVIHMIDEVFAIILFQQHGCHLGVALEGG